MERHHVIMNVWLNSFFTSVCCGLSTLSLIWVSPEEPPGFFWDLEPSGVSSLGRLLNSRAPFPQLQVWTPGRLRRRQLSPYSLLRPRSAAPLAPVPETYWTWFQPDFHGSAPGRPWFVLLCLVPPGRQTFWSFCWKSEPEFWRPGVRQEFELCGRCGSAWSPPAAPRPAPLLVPLRRRCFPRAHFSFFLAYF